MHELADNWLNLRRGASPVSWAALGRGAPEAHCLLTCACDAWIAAYHNPLANPRVGVPSSLGMRGAAAELERRGWLHVHPAAPGRVTQIEAAGRLVELYAETHPDRLVAGPARCRVERAGEPTHYGSLRWSGKQAGEEAGELITLDTRAKQRAYRELVALNRSNLEHRWSLEWPGYDALGTPASRGGGTLIAPDALVYSRVYLRGDFSLGGRFHSLVSGVRRPHRRYLTVGGERLVELDFRAFHLRLLYDLNGIPLEPGDLYAAAGPQRELVKRLLLVAINYRWRPVDVVGQLTRTVNENAWPVALRKIREEAHHAELVGEPRTPVNVPEAWDYSEVRDAWAVVRRRHAPIADYFFSDAGVRLQAVEGRIGAEIARQFVRGSIPLLILHDGFFCPDAHVTTLRDAMHRAYARVVGCELPESEITGK